MNCAFGTGVGGLISIFSLEMFIYIWELLRCFYLPSSQEDEKDIYTSKSV